MKHFKSTLLLFLIIPLIFLEFKCPCDDNGPPKEYSHIEIVTPTEGQLVVTPAAIKVRHRGCGTVQPETFKAWKTHPEAGTDEITSHFNYSNGVWLAENEHFLAYGYTVKAQAEVETGANCYIGQGSDEVSFQTWPGTCLSGRIMWQDRSGREGFWANAKVEIRVSESNPYAGQLMAATVTDEDGYFCVNKIPVAIPVDVLIPKQPAPNESGGEECRGEKKEVMASGANTCEEGDCYDVGVIRTDCYAL